MSTSETVIVNGESRSLPETRLLRSLLGELGVDAEHARGVAVAINDEVVRKSEWTDVRLSGGDRIEVVTAKQGG